MDRIIERTKYINIDGVRTKILVCKPYLKGENEQKTKPKREQKHIRESKASMINSSIKENSYENNIRKEIKKFKESKYGRLYHF